MNVSYNYCIRNASHQIPNSIFLPIYFACSLVLATGSLIYDFKHINSSTSSWINVKHYLRLWAYWLRRSVPFEERYKRIEYLHITSTSLTYVLFPFSYIEPIGFKGPGSLFGITGHSLLQRLSHPQANITLTLQISSLELLAIETGK